MSAHSAVWIASGSIGLAMKAIPSRRARRPAWPRERSEVMRQAGTGPDQCAQAADGVDRGVAASACRAATSTASGTMPISSSKASASSPVGASSVVRPQHSISAVSASRVATCGSIRSATRPDRSTVAR